MQKIENIKRRGMQTVEQIYTELDKRSRTNNTMKTQATTQSWSVLSHIQKETETMEAVNSFTHAEPE